MSRSWYLLGQDAVDDYLRDLAAKEQLIAQERLEKELDDLRKAKQQVEQQAVEKILTEQREKAAQEESSPPQPEPAPIIQEPIEIVVPDPVPESVSPTEETPVAEGKDSVANDASARLTFIPEVDPNAATAKALKKVKGKGNI